MQHQQPEQPEQQQHRHQHISKHHQLMRTFGYGQDKKSYLPLWMLNAKGSGFRGRGRLWGHHHHKHHKHRQGILKQNCWVFKKDLC